MQNSKTQTATKETATNVKPTTGTPVSTAVSTAVSEIQTAKALPEKAIQTTIEMMRPQTITLHEKFERNKIFNSKKAFYDDFNARLDSVKEFRDRHDGSGLVLSIKNQTTAQTVDFSNQNLIISFLDEAIKQGEHIKEKCEIEMMNLEI